MLDFQHFELLTFDCYGTLIDWETGLLGALRKVLNNHGKRLDDAAVLKIYGQLEPKLQRNGFRNYYDILENVVRGFGEQLGFKPTETEAASLPESLKNWQPFSDTVPALKKLKSKYKLAIISNTDDDLFAGSAKLLQVPFDYVTTAQQAGAYKPSFAPFNLAMKKAGIHKERILHVAQSIYHDIVPAKSLGLATVWVNRNASKLFAAAGKNRPDLEVPDLRTLAALAIPA